MRQLFIIIAISFMVLNISAQDEDVIYSITGPIGYGEYTIENAFDDDWDSYYYPDEEQHEFEITCVLTHTIYAAIVTVKANYAGITIGEFFISQNTTESFYYIYPDGFSSIDISHIKPNIGVELYEISVEEKDITQITPSYEYDDAGNMTFRSMVLYLSPAQKSARGIPLKDSLANHVVTIFPNPTKGELKLQIANLGNKDKVSYSLLNSNGASLQTGDFYEEESLLDLEEHLPGIYYLQLVINSKAQTYTIIKE